MPLAYRMPIKTTTAAKFVFCFSPCHALGNESVTMERCTNINHKPRNQMLCAGCKSPYRNCTICTQLGLFNYRSRASNPSTGLCEFHTKNGIHAMPEPIEDTDMNAKFQAPVDSRPPPKPFYQKKISGLHRQQARVIPELKDEVSESDLQHMAELLAKHFNELTHMQKSVIRLYALGKSNSEIAIELKTSSTTLTQINVYLATILRLPRFNHRNTHDRGHLRQQLLKEVYELYEDGLAKR